MSNTPTPGVPPNDELANWTLGEFQVLIIACAAYLDDRALFYAPVDGAGCSEAAYFARQGYLSVWFSDDEGTYYQATEQGRIAADAACKFLGFVSLELQ